MMDIFQVIKEPHITEKASLLKEGHNQISLKVHKRVNKTEIKKAVEILFKTKVLDVRTAVYRGKSSVVMNRRGRFQGYRPNWKKAFVTLADGDTIDIFDVV